LVSFLFLVPLTAHAGSAPRPLSDAERQGAQLAVDYLSKGPSSWWDALSRRSPYRALGKEAALAELEVRAGPPAGARWELRTGAPTLPPGTVIFSVDYPSGLDATLLLNLVEEEGRWKIHSARTLSEPKLGAIAPASPAAPHPAASDDLKQLLAIPVAGFVLAAMTFVLALVFRRQVAVAIFLGAFGALLVGTAFLLLVRARQRIEATRAPPPAGAAVESFVRLAPLLPYLYSLELGQKAVSAPTEGAPGVVAKLMGAQLAMQAGALKESRAALGSFPSPADIPWVEVLRGRLGFLQKNEVDTALAYERANELGPLHDGLLLEATQAFAILGFQAQRVQTLARLDGLGSRAAEAHYLFALEAALDRRLDDAERAFLNGWHLRPLERREVFGIRGALWEVLRRPAIFPELRLDSPLEPTVDPPIPAVRAISLPPDVAPHRCASLFRATFPNSAELLVPNGAELTPPGVVAEDSGAQGRSEEEQALRQLEKLVPKVASVGAFAQPMLRQQVERTVTALVRQHRWRDVASLTAGLSGTDEQVPPNLLLLRAEALRRTNRAELAKKLLSEVAQNPALLRRNDPVLLYRLGELYVEFEDFETAATLVQRAAELLKADFLSDRVRQIKEEQRLSRAYGTLASGHFDIRYPQDQRSGVPNEAARILTAEWTRMEKWIPSVAGRPVTVQLLWYHEFRQSFGGEVLGLYDGKIRVPLAGFDRFQPPLVALMSHELAHAMIADATDDKAPHWFQEGLAQRLEMKKFRPNHVAFYREKGTFLSLSGLEGVLVSFSDFELVEAAYHQSEWVLIFIEQRFGIGAIHRLLEAFKAGKTTDEAIRAALEVSSVELHDQLLSWALSAPKMRTETEIVRYDTSPSSEFRPASSAPVPAMPTIVPFPTETPKAKKPIPDSLLNSPLRRE